MLYNLSIRHCVNCISQILILYFFFFFLTFDYIFSMRKALHFLKHKKLEYINNHHPNVFLSLWVHLFLIWLLHVQFFCYLPVTHSGLIIFWSVHTIILIPLSILHGTGQDLSWYVVLKYLKRLYILPQLNRWC